MGRCVAGHPAALGPSSGLIPQMRRSRGRASGCRSPPRRLVARLRARGHTLGDIREATDRAGWRRADREPVAAVREHQTRDQADARRPGASAGPDRRIWTSLGLPAPGDRAMTDEDVQALRYAASMLASGSRWWRSCSSRACMARRSRRSPTPRSACSTSTCTSP